MRTVGALALAILVLPLTSAAAAPGTGTVQLAVDTAPDSTIAVTLGGPLGATVLDGSPATARPATKTVAGVAAAGTTGARNGKPQTVPAPPEEATYE